MKFHLRWKDVDGVRYYLAEWSEPSNEKGARAKRRTKSLGIHGPISGRGAPAARREAELRLVEFEREAQKVARVQDRPPTVAEYIEEYLASASRSVRQSTMVGYRRICRHFASLHGSLLMTDIGPRHVESFAAALQEQKPSTVNTALRCVGTAFARAVDLEIIQRNPFTMVRLARVPEKTFPRYITPEMFNTVFLPIFRPRMRAAACLAMYAGLRVGEIAALRWIDVDFDRSEIRIECRDDWQTKSGRGRVVPLLAPVREALLSLKRVSPYVVGRGPQMPNPQVFSVLWIEAVERHLPRHPEIPRITIHGLRHSYATWLASSGLPISSLRILLGHTSIVTTMIYTHVQPHTVADQVRAIAMTLTQKHPDFSGVLSGDMVQNRPENAGNEDGELMPAVQNLRN